MIFALQFHGKIDILDAIDMSPNLFHTIFLSLLLLNVFQENHLKNVCQQKFFAKSAKNYARKNWFNIGYGPRLIS